tara:strand:+ start:339 stop:857 length:519 start_codon:yes stop_codon:yes gene_type:complete
MIKEIIGIILAFMISGCSTYTQFSHPDDVSNDRPVIRDNSKRNNVYYRTDVCIEYSNYNNNYYNSRHLRWDRWKNCWVYDPYSYNGYYNGDYNYWYWHHHDDHHDNDDDYIPPSNNKKERRKNNYVRPPSNSDDNNNSSNNTQNVTSNSNSDNNSNDNSKTKTKRTKTRKRK